jgi:toxin-antitoxin system PIN domain toxin
VALAHRVHPHHKTAVGWGESLAIDATLLFCRFTQLGMLRLLTNESAMGSDVMTQAGAWRVYDRFLADSGAQFIQEPFDLDAIFRRETARAEASTKHWADAYLTAFAEAAGLTLVTFDRALAGKTKGAALLA